MRPDDQANFPLSTLPSFHSFSDGDPISYSLIKNHPTILMRQVFISQVPGIRHTVTKHGSLKGMHFFETKLIFLIHIMTTSGKAATRRIKLHLLKNHGDPTKVIEPPGS